MEHNELIQSIGHFIVISTVIPLLLFIWLYGAKSPWRANELGVALMFQKVCLLALVVIIILGNFLPAEFDLARYYLRALLFGLVAAFLWLDVLNLVRYQRGEQYDEGLLSWAKLKR